MDFSSLEKKWKERWIHDKIFEANPDSREKYFCTFPYPYVNGLLHIGHSYTLLRVEAMARYQRMQGKNVLFPQGFHLTGSPIVAAAKHVENKDPQAIQNLKDMGFSEEEIPKFSDPYHWAKIFPKLDQEHLTAMGCSIDWRRSFVTTELNPHYNEFIKWQFRKLHEKEYVQKGEHPVVWDPKANLPVGDHDRIEGEGETPQEFTLLKFKTQDGKYIVAATLRPETVHGQTNLWVSPHITYVEAKVDGERWIISEPCVHKLKQQDHSVDILGAIPGTSLLGKTVLAPGINREIPILPSYFCKPEKGTGIVTSVPSDAPDDYIGIRDLQQHPEELGKYGIQVGVVNAIKPIPIIDSKELGHAAAQKLVEEMGIKSQHERAKLEDAKKLVYKKGFYEGTMLVKGYEGMPVKEAKDKMKNELIKTKQAILFYELTGKVISRSKTECIVKIVRDQWFITYGNPEWKKLAHEALDNLVLYPEKSRAQFEYVIDWLQDWACTREYGLGTKLPWDRQWTIESLSDSTIYMAYYTIAHKITELKPENLDDEFFDYVLLGKGQATNEEAKKMRHEFEYWYPLDFRNSGKDLIQNHFSFMLFNHAAIFPKKHWPKAIGANGWVTIDGEKMSKSKGNVLFLRDLVEKYGADTVRMTVLNGGEGLEDANWDSTFATKTNQKLSVLAETILQWNKIGGQETKADRAFISEYNRIVRDATAAMEQTQFRVAIQLVYFEFQNAIKWYLRRTNNKPNKQLIQEAIRAHVIMISPFTPFIAEEIWQQLGNKGYVSLAPWPKSDETQIDNRTKIEEALIQDTITDIQQVMRLTKINEPKNITLVVAQSWLYSFLDSLKNIITETRDFKTIMGKLTVYKEHGQEITKLIPKYIKQGTIPEMLKQEEEEQVLKDATEFISRECGAPVNILLAESSQDTRAKNALPGKPAIILS